MTITIHRLGDPWPTSADPASRDAATLRAEWAIQLPTGFWKAPGDDSEPTIFPTLAAADQVLRTLGTRAARVVVRAVPLSCTARADQ